MFIAMRKFLVVVPLFLFAGTGFAQSAKIQGEVIGTDGKPLEGAQIKIDRTDIKASYNVKTDKKGHFLYANLPTGVYNLTLVVDGKDKGSTTGIRLKDGDNPPFNIDLSKPPAGGGAAALAAAAAGTGPSLLPPQGQGQGQAKAEKGLTKEQQAAQQAENERIQKLREEEIAKSKALNDSFNAGMEAKNAKNYPLAIENLEKAGALEPTQHVVWAQLGDAYMSLGDSKSGDERQAAFDKGIAAYAKAVAIKADDPNYHNNYGLALAKGKKLDQAQAELAKAAQLDPPQAGKYYYNLGAVYVNTQQNDAAEAAFKKATEVDPNYADAYYQVGLVLMGRVTLDKDGKMQAPAGTTEALQKYLALKPDGSNADAAKAILEQLGSTVATSFERPGEKKQPANPKSNQKKSK
jgi:tetratricopeptide (TPR) repeat protein